MNRILCLILGLFCASPAVTAQAQNATPAYWEGPRNVGQGACYQNAGSGVTLQSAGAGACGFTAGLNLSRNNIVKAQGSGQPFPSPADTGFYEQLTSLSGSCASGTVTCGLNYIQANESTTNGIAAAGSVSDLYLLQQVGGSAMTGGRTTIDTKFQLAATSGNTCPPCTQANYGAGRFAAFISANDGGTAFPNNGHSAVIALNSVATALSGATFLNGIAGMEVDISADTGSSLLDKIGLNISVLADDAVKAARYNIGVEIGAGSNTLPGLDIGYSIGSGSAYDPIASTGSLFACGKIGSFPGGTGGALCGTHAYGINLTQFSGFTTAAFASPGFAVDGSGNVTGASYKAGAATGVSCAAGTVSTTTMVVTGGIVTHC